MGGGVVSGRPAWANGEAAIPADPAAGWSRAVWVTTTWRGEVFVGHAEGVRPGSTVAMTARQALALADLLAEARPGIEAVVAGATGATADGEGGGQ